jgi:hypothetical protein
MCFGETGWSAAREDQEKGIISGKLVLLRAKASLGVPVWGNLVCIVGKLRGVRLDEGFLEGLLRPVSAGQLDWRRTR